MNLKQILLEQMKACHDQTNWFVTVNTALAGLNAKQAAWSDGSTSNSIWQITNHLIFWNRRYLNKFKGIPNPEFKGSNDDTFEGKGLTDADWDKTVKEIDELLSEMEKAFSEADEAKLASPMDDKNPESSWNELFGLNNIHTAYHIGQIVTLRKLQGTWDKSKGVN